MANLSLQTLVEIERLADEQASLYSDQDVMSTLNPEQSVPGIFYYIYNNAVIINEDPQMIIDLAEEIGVDTTHFSYFISFVCAAQGVSEFHVSRNDPQSHKKIDLMYEAAQRLAHGFGLYHERNEWFSWFNALIKKCIVRQREIEKNRTLQKSMKKSPPPSPN